jgi:hypothetical protein
MRRWIYFVVVLINMQNALSSRHILDVVLLSSSEIQVEA